MKCRRFFWPVVLLTGMISGHLAAQDSSAVQTLISQGMTAQSMSEWSKASTAWEKVLLSDRNHPDALRGLFFNELQTGLKDNAKSFRDRLSEVNPDHPHIAQMDNAFKLVEQGMNTLNEARRLVQAGEVKQGLSFYEISFGGVDPSGPLAIEYYTTLGGTPDGWQTAADGLQRIANENPEDWKYALPYAKHLTYNTERRREGIDLLIELARIPAAQSSAIEALRESIRWLPNRHQDIVRYQAYLSIVPDDEQIATQLATLRASRTPEQERFVQNGFAALEDNSLDQAAERFNRVLRSRSRDADALAGLGLVELRRGNFERASESLTKALRANGSDRRDWRRALNTARYWAKIERARTLFESDSFEQTRIELVSALEINEDEETGLVLMAETLRALGLQDEAERFYIRAMDANPSNAVALRGLGELYNEAGRFDDAEQLALRLNDGIDDGSDPVANEILAQGLVARARAYLKEGELDLAQVALENALKTQTTNPWIRLEFAQLLTRRGRPDRAQLLMQEMEETMPDNATALHAQAEFAFLEKRYRDALAYLERVPAGARTPQMTTTQNRVWMRLQVQRAVRFAQNNEFGQARRTLGEAENVAGSEPGMAGTLAGGWIELGEDERALAIMRTALKLNPDVGLQLQYAGLLLRTRKNEELSQVIRNLQGRSDLDEIQLKELAHIEVSLALRQSERYLRDGQYAKAYSTIETFIDWDQKYPDVRMMLGRLYQRTGDDRQALVNYDRILRDHPNHLDARRAAVGTLIDNKEYLRAQELVDSGLEMFPDHPRMVLLAGQLEAAQGRPAQALAFYRQALVLMGNSSLPFAQRNGPSASGVSPMESAQLAELGDSGSVLDVLDAPAALALESVIGLREEILTEIGRTNARTSSFFQIGGQLRNQSGESGLDKLSMFRLPARFEYGVGNSGRLSLEVAAETLDADDIQLGNVVATQRYGALSLDTSLPREETLPVSESGVGVAASYQSRYFSIDLGTTPVDYPVTNVIGGVSATNAADDLRFNASLSRRAIEDSVLSYAGRSDPFLGVTWGGVVRTGGRLEVTVDRKNQGFYASVAGYSLEGENVATNTMSQLGGGIFWRLRDSESSRLRLGLDIDTLAYDENLSFHTFGHGGYFSPQSYVNIGIPVQWSGAYSRVQYSVNGKIGFERYEQDDVAYFPNDATLQLQLEELAQTATEPQLTQHRGSSNTGVNLSLRSEVSYQVSPKLSLGSTFELSRSGNYDESRIALFARYYFSSQEVRAMNPSVETNNVLTLSGS